MKKPISKELESALDIIRITLAYGGNDKRIDAAWRVILIELEKHNRLVKRRKK